MEVSVRSVVITARAARQIGRAIEWWRTERLAAPTLLEGELSAAIERLAVFVELGPVQPRRRRRVILLKTAYHLYYRATAATVEVLALWHSHRGTTSP